MLCHNIDHNLAWDVTGKVKPCNWLDTFPSKPTVTDLKSSIEYQQLQHNNLNDVKSNFCQKCWDKESYGQTSKRQSDNKIAQIYKKLNPNFLKIDAAIGDKCNAACVICNPNSSSLWQKELYGKIIPIRKNTTLWNEILERQENIVQLDFGGGEPWVNDLPQQIELLQTLINEGISTHIKLRYNTNGSIFPKQLINLFEKFREVEITLSIDDIEERFEYNRYPLKWVEVYQNVLRLVDLERNNAIIKLTINYTISVFTFLYYEKFVEYSKTALGISNISTSVLHNPIEYNIKSLPKFCKERVLNTNIFYNLLGTEPLENWNQCFLDKVTILEQRRDNSFQKTFPKLYNTLF